MKVEQPVFVVSKKEFDNKINKLIASKKKEGYKVRTHKLYFSPFNKQLEKKVKILISFRKPCLSFPFGICHILRADGTWK